MANIGEEQETIEIQPLTEPVPSPVELPDTEPGESPVIKPAEEPVPA